MPTQVTIHRALDVPAAGDEAEGVDQVAITYSARNVPPRTVFVDKDKDTPEERQRVIQADLEDAQRERPTPLELP